MWGLAEEGDEGLGVEGRVGWGPRTWEMSACQSRWWGMFYISQLKTTWVHILTWLQQNSPFWIVFCFLAWKGFCFFSFSLFSDLITIFCYCMQLRNSISLNSETSKATRRQPDRKHVGAVLSTGSVHVPKLLSAPTVSSYTPVSLGWAKSKPCCEVLPQGHGSRAQNQGQLQNWWGPIVTIAKSLPDSYQSAS